MYDTKPKSKINLGAVGLLVVEVAVVVGVGWALNRSFTGINRRLEEQNSIARAQFHYTLCLDGPQRDFKDVLENCSALAQKEMNIAQGIITLDSPKLVVNRDDVTIKNSNGEMIVKWEVPTVPVTAEYAEGDDPDESKEVILPREWFEQDEKALETKK